MKELKLPEPTKMGATFLGWYHSNGTKYTEHQPGMRTSIELKSKWAGGQNRCLSAHQK